VVPVDLPIPPDVWSFCKEQHKADYDACWDAYRAELATCIRGPNNELDMACVDRAQANHESCMMEAGATLADCVVTGTVAVLLEKCAQQAAGVNAAFDPARYKDVAEDCVLVADALFAVSPVLVGAGMAGGIVIAGGIVVSPVLLLAAGSFVFGLALGLYAGAFVLRQMARDGHARNDFKVCERAAQVDRNAFAGALEPEVRVFGSLMADSIELSRAIAALSRSHGRLNGLADADVAPASRLDYANQQVGAIAHNAFLAKLAADNIARRSIDANRQIERWAANAGAADGVDLKAAARHALEKELPGIWQALGCTSGEIARFRKDGEKQIARLPAVAPKLPAKVITADHLVTLARIAQEMQRMRQAARPITM
jgi:hypothetical protein